MTEDERQEYARRQAEGMRALSPQELETRALRDADGARQAPLSLPSAQQQQNAYNMMYRAMVDNAGFEPTRPSIWARVKQWLRGY